MRRAISLLMMVVMVLAPCAAVHAASSASHHAGIMLAFSHVGHESQRSAEPSRSHEQHAECASGGHSPDHNACSSSCDLLQRVTLQKASERASADFKKSWIAIGAVALNDASLALELKPAVTCRLRPIGLNQDSRTVLRETARLRL